MGFVFNMNILLVCSSIGGGGAERVAVNLANSIVDLGHSVVIFVRKEIDNPYFVSPKVKVIYQRKMGFYQGVFELRKLIDENVNAVISFTDIPNILSKFSLMMSTSRPIYIPTIHNDLIARDAAQSPSIRFWGVRALHKFTCRLSEKIVVVSDGARNSLSQYYGLDSKALHTINNPVLRDDELICIPEQRAFKEEVHLVAAGRLTQQKNYKMMIDVLYALNKPLSRKYLLDVYGSGELSDSLYAYAVSKGVEDKISFKGFTENLISEFKRYEIFLLTSDWEGFGNVLVEALCAGMSIVSTDCPSGPREILADGKFGRLVPVNDVAAFCAAVEEEVCRPLDISHEELCHHLDKFRNGVVAQKYIALVSNHAKAKRKD